MADRRSSSWVIVLDPRRKKILLGLRAKHSNNPKFWNFFGGGAEKDEKPRQVAVRELSEELGIRLKNPKKMANYIGKLVTKEKVMYFFLIIINAKKVPLNKFDKLENSRVRWFNVNKVPGRLHDPTKYFFRSSLYKIITKAVKKA